MIRVSNLTVFEKVLYYAVYSVIIFQAIQDGLVNRTHYITPTDFYTIGWLAYHVIGWLGRNIPMFILLISYDIAFYEKTILHRIFFGFLHALFFWVMHLVFYELTIKSHKLFLWFGEWKPPFF